MSALSLRCSYNFPVYAAKRTFFLYKWAHLVCFQTFDVTSSSAVYGLLRQRGYFPVLQSGLGLVQRPSLASNFMRMFELLIAITQPYVPLSYLVWIIGNALQCHYEIYLYQCSRIFQLTDLLYTMLWTCLVTEVLDSRLKAPTLATYFYHSNEGGADVTRSDKIAPWNELDLCGAIAVVLGSRSCSWSCSLSSRLSPTRSFCARRSCKSLSFSLSLYWVYMFFMKYESEDDAAWPDPGNGSARVRLEEHLHTLKHNHTHT